MSYRIGQAIIDNTNGSISSTSNLLDTSYFSEVDSALIRFAIQSEPGARFQLNDADIIIGRSGTYELPADLVVITSIKVLSRHKFIIDYRY